MYEVREERMLQKEIKDLQSSTQRWKLGVIELKEPLTETSETSAVERPQTRTSAHISVGLLKP